ncbi:MAG TPA: hypothetical protein VHE30_21370 [Polyangiaceae bacterium]|nr:hypothetical protein [Polyangiaceae bacterium]
MLQVWRPLPEQIFAPGVHTPVQIPATHAWPEQVVPSLQVPVASQLCVTKPLH